LFRSLEHQHDPGRLRHDSPTNIAGSEVTAVISKGQVHTTTGDDDMRAQAAFVAGLFNVAVWSFQQNPAFSIGDRALGACQKPSNRDPVALTQQ